MALTDEALVDIIRKQSDPMQCGEMLTLIYRYTRVIRLRAAKLRTVDIDMEDLQQEGYIALFDAVKSFDAQKSSFSTFAGVCISNRMKNAVSKASSRYEKAEDYDLELVEDENAAIDDYVIVKEYDEEIKAKLSSILTEKEYSVFALYLDGYTYKQIAEKTGISVKSVDNSLSRTRKKLKELL